MKFPGFLPSVFFSALILLSACTLPPNRQQEKSSPQSAKTLTEESGSAAYGGKFCYAGEPIPQGYPHGLNRLLNQAYIVAFDETRRNPAWAAYFIPAERKFGPLPRPSRFITDFRTAARVTHDDYTNTGYDRGHMAPNQAIASRFGETAQRETFFLSNIAPQAPALNQGPWRLLEDVLADTTSRIGTGAWVVVGPIYQEPIRRLSAGPAIPGAFFMVVAVETRTGPRVQAFIMSQSTSRGDDFRSYLTSVDHVEEVTHFDFFPGLPDEIEAVLEGSPAPYWLEAR